MHREHTEHMHATHTAHTHSCPLVPAEDRFQNPTNTGNARLLESLTLNGVEFAWNYNPLYTLNHLCSTRSTCLVSNRHARLTLCRRFLAEAWLPSPLLLLSSLSVCHVCVPFQARALLLLTAGLPPAQACRSSFGHQVVLHTVPCSWHPPCLWREALGVTCPQRKGLFWPHNAAVPLKPGRSRFFPVETAQEWPFPGWICAQSPSAIHCPLPGNTRRAY
jgi:hypothetical protein